MLQWQGRARVSLSLSISDAISTAVLEAIVMGAFPIQSDTSCAHEWIDGTHTGFLVPPEAPEEVASALRRALTDDALVDAAAERNGAVAARRLDGAMLRRHVVDMYRNMIAAQ
jgi:glycosyltransferase involved in cell wall biosynthesis